jgi:DNA-directed RNA polymerase I and III subunit RPAC1
MCPPSLDQVSTTNFPGYDNNNKNSIFSIDHFNQNTKLDITLLSNSEIEFDLVGVDPALANALRRITIAEVPTIAIETVYVWNNTSIVQDEVLAQRLGLIPLAIDPNFVEFKANAEEAPTDLNTIVFNLVAKCERRKDVKKGETNPELIWTGSRVLSSQLAFDPKGSQLDLFKDGLPKPAINEILIAKMRGGQEVVAELHCNKGLGKEHAKWSPVGE